MKTVLLIEDDPWLGKAFTNTLVYAGKNVVHAKDTATAIDNIDEYKIDVVVLDMFLPDATGMQFLHEIKSYDDTHKIPILICTANPGELSLKLLKPYGVLTVLDKAKLTPQGLVSAVDEVTVNGHV